MPSTKQFQIREVIDGAPAVTSSAVREQLRRLLDSPEFHATDAQRAFLEYVVEKTLADQVAEIKGYTIATRVFGRREDFDQARDPIVSIQANKLRRALERYYLVEGGTDQICITIPKGGYVPVFEYQNHIYPGQDSARQPDSLETDGWPTIIVQSFDNQTNRQDLAYIGAGIATEIALEMTRYQEIRVLRHHPEQGKRTIGDIRARFMLGGSIKKIISGLKVIVHLTDLMSGIQVWADSYHTDLNPDAIITFEERVAKEIAGKILCEYGIITKTLSLESARTPPAGLKTHQAILRFYQFSVEFSAQAFMEAYQALKQACSSEPECGLIWSMLARLYALNYSMELFDVPTSLEESTCFAQKGVNLEPGNQKVRLHYAFVLFFNNELSAGLTELEYAWRLNPKSLIFLENIGYLMTLFGDWQRGPALIKQAIGRNPYYNPTVHYALWLDWVRQKKYEQAYKETLHFARPALFWDPLLKAAILGLLGRGEEGAQVGKELLRCKPNFSSRGRSLIQHYIKHEDLVTKVITGLTRSGVHVT